MLACAETTGSIVGAALHGTRAFLHGGLLSSAQSPLARAFVTELVEGVLHCRFEPTALDADEVVMALLVDVLLEFVRVTVEGVSAEPRSPGEELVGEAFVFEFIDLLFVLLNQTRFSELLRCKAVDTAAELCVLLCSCLRAFDAAPAPADAQHTSRISFPVIAGPVRKAPAADKAPVPVPVPVPVASQDAMDDNTTVVSYASPDSLAPSATAALPRDFDPFSPDNDEAANQLAPGVLEEVQQFRARLAAQAEAADSDADGEGTCAAELAAVHLGPGDVLSRHCVGELLRFLTASIDVVDENSAPRKAPGSAKAEPTATDTSTSTAPTIKTQAAALRCLVGMFTDPLSELSQAPAQPLTPFQAHVVELIGDGLLRNLLGMLALDASARHLPALTQLLLAILDTYRLHVPAQFEFFLSTCFTLVSARAATAPGTGSATTPPLAPATRPMARPALVALKLACLEMLAYVRTPGGGARARTQLV